jgi:hypothetical protein
MLILLLGLLKTQAIKLFQPAGCWLTVPASKSSLKKLPLVVEELELLDELVELVEPDVELDELELLEDELLLDMVPEDEELELLLEEELVEPVVELELELEELLEVPSPVQAGAIKVPSCVPWKPKTLLAVCPGAGSCQLC